MKVSLHPEADSEFAHAVEYYESKQSGLGTRFYEETLQALDWIAANPIMPRLRRNYRRVNLPVFPFYIAYIVTLDLIFVIAVAHAHRKPDYWSARMNR